MQRVLSVARARSLYLQSVNESKRHDSSKERAEALKQLKVAERTLQQAQMHERLRSRGKARIVRPSDWNEELN